MGICYGKYKTDFFLFSDEYWQIIVEWWYCEIKDFKCRNNFF